MARFDELGKAIGIAVSRMKVESEIYLKEMVLIHHQLKQNHSYLMSL